jgi:hypothetical protein
MAEWWQWVVSISAFVIAVVFFVLVITLLNRKKARADMYYRMLVESTEEYYRNLTLKEGKYFPYFREHACSVLNKYGNKDVKKDPITKLELPKGYVYLIDRLLYIISDKIVTKPMVVNIDGEEYIEVNNLTKRLQVLITFTKHDHMLVSYKVIRNDKDNFSLEVENIEKGDIKNAKDKKETPNTDK